MDELPKDWRRRMVQLVSGQVPAEASLFAGGPVLSPMQQISIYRRQYVLRLTEAIEEDLLGLGKLVGQELLHVWVLDYLAAHPSRSWTLNRASLKFADWLAEREVPVEQVEMARVDRAVQMGFEAADGEPLELSDLIAMPALALAPHVHLLLNTTNIHAIRSALLNDREAPELVVGPQHLVLYRVDRGMRHWVMEPAPWHVLRYIQEGASVLEALEKVVVDGLVQPSELEGAVASWFKDFAGDGLVVRAGGGA